MAGENIHYLNEASKADVWIYASNFAILISFHRLPLWIFIYFLNCSFTLLILYKEIATHWLIRNIYPLTFSGMTVCKFSLITLINYWLNHYEIITFPQFANWTAFKEILLFISTIKQYFYYKVSFIFLNTIKMRQCFYSEKIPITFSISYIITSFLIFFPSNNIPFLSFINYLNANY